MGTTSQKFILSAGGGHGHIVALDLSLLDMNARLTPDGHKKQIDLATFMYTNRLDTKDRFRGDVLTTSSRDPNQVVILVKSDGTLNTTLETITGKPLTKKAKTAVQSAQKLYLSAVTPTVTPAHKVTPT